MTTVYLNGSYLPIKKAFVSVLDRGFLFGDGVYEVIPAYGNRLFRLQHHLQRLQNSLGEIQLENPLDNTQWETMLTKLLQQNSPSENPDADQSVYLQVTRGTAEKRDHRFPDVVTPTVYATSQPLTVDATAAAGISAITLDDTRWLRCNIKAITLLPNVLLRQQAADQNAGEALLIRGGYAVEGSASNLFVVKDNILITPPKGPQLLPGITRDLVLELAELHGLPWQETDIPVALLNDADEIWVTSSTREIAPVTRLDKQKVNDGKVGPLWEKMAGYYHRYKEDVRSGRAA